MLFYPHLKLKQGKMKFYVWHLKAKGPDQLDCSYTAHTSNEDLPLLGFFPLSSAREECQRGMTPVLHKYSTGHLALRHLTFLLKSSQFLCLAVLFMTLPKHVYSTRCESPLQTDKDQHLNLTFSISASEWDFQSFEYNSYIPLLLGLVKAVPRSYSKCQIVTQKIAGIRSDFLLLTLGFSFEAQNFEYSVSTWVRLSE